MTPAARLDDALVAWFQADAAGPAPVGLAGRVIERTGTRRPRPGWLAILRQAPLEAASRSLPSRSAARLAWVGFVLLLTLAAAVAVIIGSGLVQERRVITSIAPHPLLERDGHQALRLIDGRVLLLGGSASGPTLDAALLDPWTGDVREIAMAQQHGWGTAIAELEDGRVLVAGGGPADTVTAEVFDATTDTFTLVGSMTSARGGATVLKVFVPVAVPLADGRVLIVGGTTEQLSDRAFPRPGDIFDPVTNTFSATPPLPCGGVPDGGMSGQEVRTADLLPDGRILLSCEGWSHPRYASVPEAPQAFFAFDVESGSAERLDIAAGVVDLTMRLDDAALLLWISSGEDRVANGERVSRYRLARLDVPSLSSADLGVEVTWGTARTALDSGQVVLAGGYEPGTGMPADAVRLLDPCTGALTSVATLSRTRVGGTITPLDDEHLLLVGGQLGRDPDMYEPAEPEIVRLSEAPGPACTG